MKFFVELDYGFVNGLIFKFYYWHESLFALPIFATNFPGNSFEFSKTAIESNETDANNNQWGSEDKSFPTFIVKGIQ
ncbi:CLUMA_CG016782, isoform A [Clunio marinus]|uniref:CLUMA_CG016782, isoform A n=1 Tax=Clunio marinus TaxID=568069 RepID=A0A1J1IVN9_9DIPT|nr:CLUMA_CG016782, isoform A [Clunio marinus]